MLLLWSPRQTQEEVVVDNGVVIVGGSGGILVVFPLTDGKDEGTEVSSGSGFPKGLRLVFPSFQRLC